MLERNNSSNESTTDQKQRFLKQKNDFGVPTS